jgi:hypothetical protein
MITNNATTDNIIACGILSRFFIQTYIPPDSILQILIPQLLEETIVPRNIQNGDDSFSYVS